MTEAVEKQSNTRDLVKLCRTRFDVMQALGRELAPLNARAEAARVAWESACLDLAFAEYPEIKGAIAEVERLEAELRVAKQVVAQLADRTDDQYKFRKWMP